jgi:hypothetical protein
MTVGRGQPREPSLSFVKRSHSPVKFLSGRGSRQFQASTGFPRQSGCSRLPCLPLRPGRWRRFEAVVGGVGGQRLPDSRSFAMAGDGHLARPVCISGPWLCAALDVGSNVEPRVQMWADPSCALTRGGLVHGGLQRGMPFTGLSLAPSSRAVSGNQSQTPLSLRVQNHHELVCPVWKTGLVC